MGWALVHLAAALIWFGMFVGVAFFDYEPSRFAVGFAFFCTSLMCLRSMAEEVLKP